MNRRSFIKTFGTGAIGLAIAPSALASEGIRPTNQDICKTTWDQLCGKIGEVYKTDAFEYVSPVRKRPNVLLYGDSVSIQYSSSVRKELEGKATVIRLFKNGGSSRDFIRNMDTMKETMFQPSLPKGWKFKWDVIHFNVGLHDLKYLSNGHLKKKGGTQVSTLQDYKTQLEDICQYLKAEYPKAKLIFATTTPVPENAKGRYKGDSIKYNKAALEVLKAHPEIMINDLYTFTLPHHQEWAEEGLGNVHYNAQGSSQHGKKVADAILKALKSK